MKFGIRNPFVWKGSEAAPQTLPTTHPDIAALIAAAKLPSKFTAHVSRPPKLEKDENEAWLFEYGEGMYQMPGHGILEGSSYVQPGYTLTKFNLWNKLQGRHTFPIALKTSGHQRAPVFGQLYRVPKRVVPSIDNHRWNGVYFTRKPTVLQLPYTKTITVSADGMKPQNFEYRATRPFLAWMYVGNPMCWCPRIGWDRDFWKRDGNAFKLAGRVKNYDLNKSIYVFDRDDVGKRNYPQNEMRFFRTRSARDQERVWEIDNAEQDLYESDEKQVIVENNLPAMPIRR